VTPRLCSTRCVTERENGDPTFGTYGHDNEVDETYFRKVLLCATAQVLSDGVLRSRRITSWQKRRSPATQAHGRMRGSHHRC